VPLKVSLVKRLISFSHPLQTLYAISTISLSLLFEPVLHSGNKVKLQQAQSGLVPLTGIFKATQLSHPSTGRCNQYLRWFRVSSTAGEKWQVLCNCIRCDEDSWNTGLSW